MVESMSDLPLFLQQLCHLLARAWFLLVSWMGTSTLAILVGLAIFLVTQLPLLRNRSTWKQRIRQSLGRGVIITFSAWLILYSASVIATVYKNHVFLVEANKGLQNDLAKLEAENQELKKIPKAYSRGVVETYPTQATVEPNLRIDRQVRPAQKITAVRHLMNFFLYNRRMGSVSCESLIGNDEALAFSRQLQDVFASGGWTVKTGEISPRVWKTLSDLPAVGVVLVTNKPDYEFLAVQDALLAAGVVPRTDIQGTNVKKIDGVVILIGENK